MRASIGSAAGIEWHELAQLPSTDALVRITCIDYCPEHHQERQIKPEELADFLQHHRPPWSAVRWINVDGLTNMQVISALAQKYKLHPLAIEDMLRLGQRPKADSYHAEGEYQPRLGVIVKMLEIAGDDVESDQVTLFLGHHTVLTFQHAAGDVWDPIRQRIAQAGSRLRTNDASFLVYSLLDATVDHFFPILEHFGEKLEDLEENIMQQATQETIQQIHRLKRQLMHLRHAAWPMRELVRNLQQEGHECFSDMSRTYMRDVYDHLVQIMDVIEGYREASMSLTETYMNVVSNRMNEIIKVLTIIGTIFIPLTFLAGVYGMNFKNMPELDKWWAYPAFWGICVVLVVVMVAWFRKKKWL